MARWRCIAYLHMKGLRIALGRGRNATAWYPCIFIFYSCTMQAYGRLLFLYSKIQYGNTYWYWYWCWWYTFAFSDEALSELTVHVAWFMSWVNFVEGMVVCGLLGPSWGREKTWPNLVRSPHSSLSESSLSQLRSSNIAYSLTFSGSRKKFPTSSSRSRC